jgi:hypothetical protein
MYIAYVLNYLQLTFKYIFTPVLFQCPDRNSGIYYMVGQTWYLSVSSVVSHRVTTLPTSRSPLKTLTTALERDDNRLATNSPDIIANNAGLSHFPTNPLIFMREITSLYTVRTFISNKNCLPSIGLREFHANTMFLILKLYKSTVGCNYYIKVFLASLNVKFMYQIA